MPPCLRKVVSVFSRKSAPRPSTTYNCIWKLVFLWITVTLHQDKHTQPRLIFYPSPFFLGEKAAIFTHMTYLPSPPPKILLKSGCMPQAGNIISLPRIEAWSQCKVAADTSSFSLQAARTEGKSPAGVDPVVDTMVQLHFTWIPVPSKV